VKLACDPSGLTRLATIGVLALLYAAAVRHYSGLSSHQVRAALCKMTSTDAAPVSAYRARRHGRSIRGSVAYSAASTESDRAGDSRAL
jgi:hypothetical protein